LNKDLKRMTMAMQQNQAGDRQTNAADLAASGVDIIKGARNEDQLDQMREAARLTAEGNTQEQGDNPVNATDGLDDLNEIRAADALGEPDPEARYEPTDTAGPEGSQAKD
jgi:hypothetical protein